ncbi:DUF4352 domain-containing protein [Methanocalculus taiwanensis]|uniref:DUF4352 domain-containing protein n=1 Tax=Methanocalculus taiwanensis TaxID=106207 RepID=A0ABD4TLI6_9EURY|nr:DUF4352 domain-containing protein [Methanocalculus taiwanensis]MCQ1538838.1 DUF4352 domain-containing protein [Methanocalculus taiwanensis]
MKKTLLLTAAFIVIVLVLFAGCTESPQTPEPGAVETPVHTTEPTATPSPAAPVQAASPFPNALPLKAIASVGDGESTREISVYKYLIRDGYEFYSHDWGRWEPVSPPEGKEFLIIFVRVRHIGTKKEISAPYPSIITVHTSGNAYSYKSGRDPTIPINDVREMEYTGGKLYIHETKEGFIIYEVPKGISPFETYVSIFLPEEEAPVWKLA